MTGFDLILCVVAIFSIPALVARYVASAQLPPLSEADRPVKAIAAEPHAPPGWTINSKGQATRRCDTHGTEHGVHGCGACRHAPFDGWAHDR